MRVAFLSQGPIYEAPAIPYRLLTGYAGQEPAIQERVTFTHLPLQAFPPGTAARRICLETAERISSEDHDVLALSLYCWNTPNLLSVARYAKQMKPAMTIIAGGPDTYNEGCPLLAQNPELDFVIDRDGELPFRMLIKHLLLGTSHPLSSLPSEAHSHTSLARQPSPAPMAPASTLDSIPWLSYREGATARMSRTRTIIDNLDEIPSPVLGGSRSDLLTRFYEEDFAAIVLETSRGCPVNCKFCQYPKAGSGTWRYFSLERVLSELRYLKDLDINEVYFADGIFTLDKRRAAAILDFFIREMTQARLQVEVKLDILPDLLVNQFRALLDQERLRFGVGIQSVNESTLEVIGRPTNLRKLKDNVDKLATDRPRTMRWDLIYGLPGDSIQDLIAGFDFIYAAAPDGRVAVQALHVLPGTEIRARAKELGIVYDFDAPYNVLKTPTFPPRDLAIAGIISLLLGVFTPALSIIFRRDRLGVSLPSPFKRIFEPSFLDTIHQEGSLTLTLQLLFVDRLCGLFPSSGNSQEFLRETLEHLFILANIGRPGWRIAAQTLRSYRGHPNGNISAVGPDTLIRHVRLFDAIDKFQFQFDVRPWVEPGERDGSTLTWFPNRDPRWLLVAGGQIQVLSEATYQLLESLSGPVSTEAALKDLQAKDLKWSSETPSGISSIVAAFVADGLLDVCAQKAR